MLNCQWDASVRILHLLWTPPTGHRLHSRTLGVKILPPHLASGHCQEHPDKLSYLWCLWQRLCTGDSKKKESYKRKASALWSTKNLDYVIWRWSEYAPLFSNWPQKNLSYYLILSFILSYLIKQILCYSLRLVCEGRTCLQRTLYQPSCQITPPGEALKLTVVPQKWDEFTPEPRAEATKHHNILQNVSRANNADYHS